METHGNNNNIEKEKMKIIKFTTFIFTIGIVIMVVAIIMMTIGILQFDVQQYASSITAVYLVALLSLITQLIPLWSIHQMLEDIEHQKIDSISKKESDYILDDVEQMQSILKEDASEGLESYKALKFKSIENDY